MQLSIHSSPLKLEFRNGSSVLPLYPSGNPPPTFRICHGCYRYPETMFQFYNTKAMFFQQYQPVKKPLEMMVMIRFGERFFPINGELII